MSDVFLSYSRDDIWIMRSIRAELRAEGFDVWADESLLPGDASWRDIIEEAIENTTCVIVVLTENAKGSQWIEQELEYARLHNKAIIPIHAGGDERKAIPVELVTAQRVDIRTNYQAGLQTIISAIKTHLTEEQLREQSQRAGVDTHTVRWDRTGSLFWICSDLHFAMGALSRGGSVEDINRGLRQSLHHAERLNFGDDIIKTLRRLREVAAYYTEDDWTPERRRQFQEEVKQAYRAIRDIVTRSDPDWEPWAKD